MSSKTKERLFSVLHLLGVVGLLGLFGGLVYWIFYASLNAGTFPDWTGFNTRAAPDDMYPARTLLLFTWFENRQTRAIEQNRVLENRRIEEERLKEARRLEAQRLEEVRELEDNRAQDAIVKDYLDQMTELLLTRGLRTSLDGDDVRSVSRARTLGALGGVDRVRQGTIIQFLYEARLIGYGCDEDGGYEIVDVLDTDPRQTDGSRLSLYAYSCGGDRRVGSIVGMQGVNLNGTYLVGAYLHEVNLERIHLNGADLSGAHLNGASLVKAHLNRADLSEAHLARANLKGAVLKDARLRRAMLVRTNFSGADLSGADLSGACLVEARFFGANLTEANLSEANLSRADLTHCFILTPDQLLQAKSLHGAILPDYINPTNLGDKWSPPKSENTPEPTP